MALEDTESDDTGTAAAPAVSDRMQEFADYGIDLSKIDPETLAADLETAEKYRGKDLVESSVVEHKAMEKLYQAIQRAKGDPKIRTQLAAELGIKVAPDDDGDDDEPSSRRTSSQVEELKRALEAQHRTLMQLQQKAAADESAKQAQRSVAAAESALDSAVASIPGAKDIPPQRLVKSFFRDIKAGEFGNESNGAPKVPTKMQVTKWVKEQVKERGEDAPAQRRTKLGSGSSISIDKDLDDEAFLDAVANKFGFE